MLQVRHLKTTSDALAASSRDEQRDVFFGTAIADHRTPSSLLTSINGAASFASCSGGRWSDAAGSGRYVFRRRQPRLQRPRPDDKRMRTRLRAVGSDTPPCIIQPDRETNTAVSSCSGNSSVGGWLSSKPCRRRRRRFALCSGRQVCPPGQQMTPRLAASAGRGSSGRRVPYAPVTIIDWLK